MSLGAPVVYEFKTHSSAYYVSSSGDVETAADIAAFQAHLSQSATVYICDTGGNAAEPPNCFAFTLVLSSPDRSHYKQWLTSKVTLYAPPWSLEEALGFRLPSCNEASVRSRFEDIGGIARYLFCDEVLAKQYTAAATARLAAADLCLVEELLSAPPWVLTADFRIPFHLLHIFPLEAADGTVDYYQGTLRLPSRALSDLFVSALAEKNSSDLLGFLTKTVQNSVLAGLRGQVFEVYARQTIARGGS